MGDNRGKLQIRSTAGERVRKKETPAEISSVRRSSESVTETMDKMEDIGRNLRNSRRKKVH